MIRRSVWSKLLSSTATAALFLGMGGFTQAARAEQPKADNVEEIVVTATKRAVRLQDTAEAINVIGSDSLQKLGATSFQDYSSLVPNLNQSNGAGGGGGNIVLRGLYTAGNSLSATTSVYLDDAPFTPNGYYGLGAYSTPDPDLVDVDHIEVLKGPQGTLYGASSLGGLIRVVTKEPNLSKDGLNGSVQIGGSAVDNGNVGGVVRGSVYDALVPQVLAVGVSAFKRSDPGFITNAVTNKNNYGQVDASGAAITAVLSPTDNLKFKVRGLTQTSHTVGVLAQSDVKGTGTPIVGARETVDGAKSFLSTRYNLIQAGAEYVTSIGTLSADYSHTKNYLRQQRDESLSYGALYATYYPIYAQTTPPAGIVTSFNLNPTTSADNEEVRFTSRRLGRFEFLLGAYHSKQNSRYHALISGVSANQQALPAPLNTLADDVWTDSYSETAEFGNLTFYITDDLDVTGGVRHANPSQTGEQIAGGLIEAAGAPLRPFSIHNSVTLYQADLRWRPSKNLSLYFRSADGFRPGSPNLGATAVAFPPSNPDKVVDYEIGAKGSLFDDRLTFDGSIYYMDWQNIQLSTRVGGFAVVGNGGAASVKGAELQIGYRPVEHLNLGMSFGYNNAKVTEIDPATSKQIGAAQGERLPGSPKVTFAAYGDYDFAVTGAVTGSIGATLRYQGDKTSSFSLASSPNYLMPAYTTLDLRVSAMWKSYVVRFGIDNVTDANGLTGYNTVVVLASSPVPSMAFLTRPRTYKLSASYAF